MYFWIQVTVIKVEWRLKRVRALRGQIDSMKVLITRPSILHIDMKHRDELWYKLLESLKGCEEQAMGPRDEKAYHWWPEGENRESPVCDATRKFCKHESEREGWDEKKRN